MRDVELQAEAHAVGLQRTLPDAFGGGNCVCRLLCSGAGGLVMENERQAVSALGPNAFDGVVIRGDFSFVGNADRRHAETEDGILLREGSHLDAVNALVETVDGGFEGAVRGFGNVQDEVKSGFAGLQRTGPIAIQRCGTAAGLRLVSGWRLRGGDRQELEREKSANNE